MKKVLFIDRDGTLILEPPVDEQVDSLEKLEFYPGVFSYLSRISRELDFECVIITNQDGLGTSAFPEEDFWPAHNKMLKAFENEDIRFQNVLIDRTFPADNAKTRKPETGLLTGYLNGPYDLANSFVIGDRISDMELASNLGARGILLGRRSNNTESGTHTYAEHWQEVYEILKSAGRPVTIRRQTSETDVTVTFNPDGSGRNQISTGIGFFDHMLEQVSRHGMVDLDIQVEGDLKIDEHHTIEDTAIVLGQAFREALLNKTGLERFGFSLPMDDCLAHVAVDFGGRNWLEWDAVFKREKIGGMPTEMFFHFFKSFSDNALCNIHVKAEGNNEHHKIESIFKAFARSIKMAVRRDPNNAKIPSSKNVL